MNTDQIENEKGLCRTCMSRTSNMKSLYSQTEDDARTLLEILTYVADISVIKDNNLPDHMCAECISSMNIADHFKRMCKNSEVSLRLSLNTKGNANSNPHEDMKLFCKDCSMHFNNVTEFTLHEECHQRPYQCSICGLRFNMWDSLKEHVAQYHSHKKTGGVPQNCETKKDCLNLIKKQTECADNSSIYKSPSMESLYNADCKLEAYNVHSSENIDSAGLTNTTSFKKKSFLCKDCNEKFDTKKALKQHVHETHSIEIEAIPVAKQKRKKTESSVSYKDTMLSTGSENIEIYKSDTPDVKLETFDVEMVMKSDANTLQTYHCTMCARKFTKKESLHMHLRKHEAKMDENHSCSICHREFKHKAHLINHMVSIHVSEQRLKCNLCSNMFSTEESLKLHLVNHKNQKKHECIICEKAFNMLSTLKDHMRTHTGEKPYLCATCGRGFSQKTNLKEHIQRHLGYKPFVCNTCDQSFVTKGELSAHSRKHSGAHPFKCDTCNAGFTTSSSLVKHRRIHTGERPYTCGLCPMRFSALGTLKNHHRTHTGEKPFKCNFCEKSFAQKNDLVSHTRCHTGERPFVCSVCGQAFRQNSALKAHLKVHSHKDSAAVIPQAAHSRIPSINKEIATLFTLDLSALNVSNMTPEDVSACPIVAAENTK